MKTLGMTDGISELVSRLFIINVVSYVAAGITPLPETIYHLITGPTVNGNMTTYHSPYYFAFGILPLWSSVLTEAAIFSVPVMIICAGFAICDWWDFRKTVTLCAVSHFTEYSLTEYASSGLAIRSWYLVTILVTIVLLNATFWRLLLRGKGNRLDS